MMEDKIERLLVENQEFLLSFDDGCKGEKDKKDRRLIRLARNGSKKARDLFVKSKIRYVWNLILHDYEIRSYRKRGLEDEDLFQTALIGVMYTVEKFDFRENIKVMTYLTNNIRYSIKNAYRKYGGISVSREASSIYCRCSDIMEGYDDRVNGELLESASKKLNIGKYKICNSILAVKNRNNLYSVSSDGNIDADGIAMEKYNNRLIENYEREMDEYIDLKSVLDEMTYLSDREKYVIYNVFLRDRTQKELSKEMNCSVTAVGKIKKKAIEKIKRGLHLNI